MIQKLRSIFLAAALLAPSLANADVNCSSRDQKTTVRIESYVYEGKPSQRLIVNGEVVCDPLDKENLRWEGQYYTCGENKTPSLRAFYDDTDPHYADFDPGPPYSKTRKQTAVNCW